MKRLLWLVLLGAVALTALPQISRASDQNNINPNQAQGAHKHKRHHRRHYKSHHSGHLAQDRYPQQ
jgi:hypothetical protein